jgi:phosphoribosylformimino-5-aminoimidazole carboxamide ribonucleotide (ProFAR) isomerase
VVIVGSALFRGPGQWSAADAAADPSSVVNHDFARALTRTVGAQHVIAAVDARGGRVVIHGWKTALPLSPVTAVQQLDGYCEEFLYTHVDREGLMQGTDLAAIGAVRDATARRVTAAGGITTRAEIDALEAMNVDAVVGMAIYTGSLALE